MENIGLFIGLVILAAAILAAAVIVGGNRNVNINGPVDLASVLPISSIEDGLIVGPNGELTVGYKLFMPEVFIVKTEDAHEMHDSFVALLKTLPDGTVFHKQDFFYLSEFDSRNVDSKSLIQRKNMEHYEGRPTFHNYSNVYVTFAAKVSPRTATGSLQKKMAYPFKEPFGDIGARKEELENQLVALESRLGSIKGFKAKRMGTEELGAAVYDYLSQTYDKPAAPDSALVLNPIEVNKAGGLKVGNRNVAVLSLIEESGTLQPHVKPKTAPSSVYRNGVRYSNQIESNAGFVFPLACGLPIKHVLNTVIQVASNDHVIGHLKSEQRSLNFLSNFYPPAKLKQQVIDGFVQSVGELQLRTCYTTVSVVVDDTDIVELDKKVSLVETAFVNMNQARCYVENFDTANLFFAGIPGNSQANNRVITNTTEQAVCYLNKEAMLTSDAQGIRFTDRFGNPVVVDMWDNKDIVNRNKLIIGPSGSGKSYTINSLLEQSYYLGNDVITIDIGHSYQRLCALNGGKYFNSGNSESMRFNIFLCDKDDEGNYVYRDQSDKEATDDKINFCAAVISFIWKRSEAITNVEMELLKQSIVGYYEHVNAHKLFPDMVGYYAYLDLFNETLKADVRRKFSVDDLKILLGKYVDGQYRDLLNGKENIDITNDRFIVFELEAVQNNPELFSLVSLIIVDLVLQKISKRRGIKKTLVIDEALNFLVDPKMGEFIAYLYRTLRKKEGEVYIAMQNVNFLEGIPAIVRDSIIGNTDTKMMLDHSNHKASYNDISRILSFTKHQIELLDSLEKGPGYREFFIALNKRSFILRMEVSEFADAVYTSKEVEVKKIEALFEQLGSLPAAIEQYNENRRKQYELENK